MRKKAVSFSHSDVLTGDFSSFVKCEFICFFCYGVFHGTYTPKYSLN